MSEGLNEHQAGVNEEFPYKGIVVHVQTEDLGHEKGMVRTLVYVKGTVVFSKVNAYKDLKSLKPGDDSLPEKINWQHTAIVTGIKAGKLDTQLGLA